MSSLLEKITAPATSRVAWVLWGIYLLVIMVLVGTTIVLGCNPELHEKVTSENKLMRRIAGSTPNPDFRNITQHYRTAAQNWWAGKDLYKDHNMDGFLYFPQSALIYTPFILPPMFVGELLYRFLHMGLFAFAIWRLCRLVKMPQEGHSLFLIVTLLAIPASLSAARTGQFNMLLASLMIHAAVDLGLKQWTRATVLLVIAVMAKPLALVMILLCLVLYPEFRKRFALAVPIMVILPFLHFDSDYVFRQHELCVKMLTVASQPLENRFTDVMGMLRTFGFHPPEKVLFIVRAFAALATLGICWKAFQSRGEDWWKAFVVVAFSAAYLMVFNPRNETNSFVIFSPIVGLMAGMMFLEKRVWSGGFLAFAALSFGTDSYGPLIYPLTKIWWKPFISILVLGWMAWWVLSTKHNLVKQPE